MFYSTMSYTREVPILFHIVDHWLFHTIAAAVEATWDAEEIACVRRRIRQESSMRGFCSGVELLYIVYCIARLAKKKFNTHYFLYNDDNERNLRQRARQVRYHRRECVHLWDMQVEPPVMKKLARPLYDTSVIRFKEWTYGGPDRNGSWHSNIAILYGVTPTTQPAIFGACFVACKVCRPDEADVLAFGASQCCSYIFDH